MNSKIAYKISSQRSIQFQLDVGDQDDANLHHKRDYSSEKYPYMLIEDIYLQIMPVGSHSQNKKFSIVIQPMGCGANDLIVNAIANHHKMDLTYAICEFFRECVYMMMEYGEAFYEIVYLSEEEDEFPIAFKLVAIQPQTVTIGNGILKQYIPYHVARRLQVPQSTIIPLKDILHFALPSDMCEKRAKTFDALSLFGRPTIPDFAMPIEVFGSKHPLFDSRIYSQTREIAMAETTKDFGWDARGLSHDLPTQYYQLYRRLVFERFIIRLRDNILLVFNKGLLHIGEMIGFPMRVEINGLPSEIDVNAAMLKLEAGNTSFGAIFEPFLKN